MEWSYYYTTYSIFHGSGAASLFGIKYFSLSMETEAGTAEQCQQKY